MSKRVVGIIGVGHVGAHVAYSLAIQGIVDEIVLVDIKQSKAECECQDISDGMSWMPHRVRVRVADYGDLGDCDVIVNSTGNMDLLTHGSTDRVDEMTYTIRAVNSYVDKVMGGGFHGVFMNITNPCDVVTWRIAQLAGLPKGRVFGTGTGLDTTRLRSALARQTGIDHKSIYAYVMGEHGIAQMIPWSAINIGGRPLSEWEKDHEQFNFDREEIRKKVSHAGWALLDVKQCTEYGIASTAARLVKAVLLDEKQIMPVSATLTGEYGESGLSIGVPTIVGAGGAEEVVELPMSQEDLAEFKACCAAVRKNLELAATIK